MPGVRLQGIVPPVVTPLDEHERVDQAGLERQIRRLIEEGVHGLFLLGSTGEQPALRDEERARAVRTAARLAEGRVVLVVGTMAASTTRAIENIRAAEAAGAHAVAVAPPHYYPPRGPVEQEAHYEACAAAATGPLIVYNIPSTTKVHLSAETIARLAEIPGVIGVKDSSGDFLHFLKLLSLVREKEGFAVMIGTPPLAGAALLYGADGVVPGIANIAPRVMLDLYAAAIARNTRALWELQEKVHLLMRIVTLGAPVACIKTALELMGVCGSRAALPTQPLNESAREEIRAVLGQLDLVPRNVE